MLCNWIGWEKNQSLLQFCNEENSKIALFINASLHVEFLISLTIYFYIIIGVPFAIDNSLYKSIIIIAKTWFELKIGFLSAFVNVLFSCNSHIFNEFLIDFINLNWTYRSEHLMKSLAMTMLRMKSMSFLLLYSNPFASVILLIYIFPTKNISALHIHELDISNN